MRLSEYFGMKVFYSTLKIKKHGFHCLAEIFFHTNVELLMTILQFHKNCQNIFQNGADFAKHTYSAGFPFML